MVVIEIIEEVIKEVFVEVALFVEILFIGVLFVGFGSLSHGCGRRHVFRFVGPTYLPFDLDLGCPVRLIVPAELNLQLPYGSCETRCLHHPGRTSRTGAWSLQEPVTT